MSDARASSTRLPQVDQMLRDGGAPEAVSSPTVPGALRARDVTIIAENLARLSDALAEMAVEASKSPPTGPDASDCLSSRLRDLAICVGDARRAADRLRGVDPMADGTRSTIPPFLDGAPPESEPALDGVGRGRLLIVEDEETLASALARVLRGHDVSVVHSTRLALERIVRGDHFDVIVCDLMMPRISGAALYERVRQLRPAQAKRMMFITGGDTTPEVRAFLSRVRPPLLEKPFGANELRALVREVFCTEPQEAREIDR